MLYDAHNHLQDTRLDPWRDDLLTMLPGTGLAEMVVNGTREEDWAAVARLARDHAWIRPAFGLHPWFVKERTSQWSATLRQHLLAYPGAVVGEIGLDRWIEHPDIEAQLDCLRTQLALAVELDRPATIHCLRAWGLLEEILRGCTLPRRGFLLHSYGGPAEMIPQFAAMGARFSLSPYFGHPRKVAQLEVFKAVPLERLLAETDAPDMWPPDRLNPYPLLSATGTTLNHPANLRVSYELLAQARDLSVEEMQDIIAANYHALFAF
jgi:TatD DNase family protein